MALNDLDVLPLGRASVDSLRWTQGAQDRITLVAKATFKQGEGDQLELCDPEPLHDADMVPYRTRADVHVYGDRAQNEAADVAVSGDDPVFGAPVPVRDAPGLWQPGEGAAAPSLPDDIDWDDYQRAEGARQTPLLSGLEHVSASAGGQRIIEGDLPPWRGVVYVADKGQSWEQGDRIPMEADSLQIDSDRGLCSLVYRSVFWLDADDDLTNRVLHVGLEYAPEAEDATTAADAGAAGLAAATGAGGGLAGDGALAGDAAGAQLPGAAGDLARTPGDGGALGEAGGAPRDAEAAASASGAGRAAWDAAGAAGQSAKIPDGAAGALGQAARDAGRGAAASAGAAAAGAGAADAVSQAAAAAGQLDGLVGAFMPGAGEAAPALVGSGRDLDPGFSAVPGGSAAAVQPSSWDSSVGSSVYGRGVVGAGGGRAIQSGTMGSLAGDAMGGDSDEQATTTIKRSGAAGLAPTLPGTDAIRAALYERFKAFG